MLNRLLKKFYLRLTFKFRGQLFKIMKYLITLLTLCSIYGSQAQTINITANTPDTTIYLARYFGKGLYYADTAQAVNGKFSYDASKHKAGLYSIMLPSNHRFDVIIDNNEDVDIAIKDIYNPIETSTIKKSENNKVFVDYMRYTNKQRNAGKPSTAVLQNPESSDKEKEDAKALLTKINDEVKAYQKDIVKNHKDLFVGVMIDLTLDIELPDHPRDEEGNITDSNFVFQYYVNHYWDNVNLKDPRIVNTPVFHNKLDKYFSEKGVLQTPDSIFHYAKKLIDQTDMKNEENKVFQYIVHHVTNKYETSPVMGMDKVFHHMAKAYYCEPNNYAYWMTEENTEKVCERAEKIGRTLIGNPAIPIILPDSTEKKWHSFYDNDAEYTILYFWDPNCGHCKKITPKLQTLYEKKFKDRNIEVFAIGKATGDEFDKWKKFIRENDLTFLNVGVTPEVYSIATSKDQMELAKLLRGTTTLESLNYADTYDVYSTPRIFILDKDKVIRYKQLSIGQLEVIIDKETGHDNDEKLFPLSDPENGDAPDAE